MGEVDELQGQNGVKHLISRIEQVATACLYCSPASSSFTFFGSGTGLNTGFLFTKVPSHIIPTGFQTSKSRIFCHARAKAALKTSKF